MSFAQTKLKNKSHTFLRDFMPRLKDFLVTFLFLPRHGGIRYSGKVRDKIAAFFFLSFLFSLIFSVNFVFAAYSVEQKDLGGLSATGGGLGYDTKVTDTKSQIAIIVGQVIGVILSLVGIIFFILIWMGALDIIGANGNEELFAKGKDRIKNGFIGILVVFAAYVFANLIIMLATGGESIFKLN